MTFLYIQICISGKKGAGDVVMANRRSNFHENMLSDGLVANIIWQLIIIIIITKVFDTVEYKREKK